MNNQYFMEKALELARKALSENEFPVGCILEYEGRIIAEGSRIGTLGTNPNETDHAEMVALRRLFLSPETFERSGITALCTMEPCLMCFGALLIAGVGRIVFAYEDAMGGGTKCDLTVLPELYRNNPVRIISGVMRKQSLELFQSYFSNPENDYWRGSFLAEYTLGQT